jgi:hypothetical protein
MHKKLITASLALVALAAFALPAAAQAATNATLTHPTGTAFSLTGKTCTTITGACVKATNVGNTLMTNTTGGIEFTCTGATMTGILKNNTTGNVQGDIHLAEFSGTGSGGACTGFFGLDFPVDPLNMGTGAGQGWCVKATSAMGTDEFQVFGGHCSEPAKKIEFRRTLGSGQCTYRSTFTTAFRGEYRTHSTGDAILTTPRAGSSATADAGFEKISDTTFGNVCISSTGLDMSFTLETDTATAEPFYISE